MGPCSLHMIDRPFRSPMNEDTDVPAKATKKAQIRQRGRSAFAMEPMHSTLSDWSNPDLEPIFLAASTTIEFLFLVAVVAFCRVHCQQTWKPLASLCTVHHFVLTCGAFLAMFCSWPWFDQSPSPRPHECSM